MFLQNLSLLLLTLCQLAAAFPRLPADQFDVHLKHSKADAKNCPFAAHGPEKDDPASPFLTHNHAKKSTAFNAQQQRIDVSGDHEWRAPNFAAGDQRGKIVPCRYGRIILTSTRALSRPERVGQPWLSSS